MVVASEQAAQVKSVFMYFGEEQWHFPSVMEKAAPEEAPKQTQRSLELAPVVLGSEQEEQVPLASMYFVAGQWHMPSIWEKTVPEDGS